MYLDEEPWARDVVKKNLFEVREESKMLAEDLDAVNTGIKQLIREIREEDIAARENAQEVVDRTFRLGQALREDLRRRYRRKRTALLDFEEVLIIEDVSKLDDEERGMEILLAGVGAGG